AKAAAVCARSAAAGSDSDIVEPPDHQKRGSYATGPGTGFHAALPEGHDYWRLLPALGWLRGHLGLDLYVLTDGLEGGFRRPGAPTPVAYRPPEPGRPLLILDDLGCLGEPAERAAWRGFGRLLQRSGVSPIALMPCPPRLWDPRLAGLYFPVTWDRAHRLPRRPAGPRPWPAALPEPTDDLGAARLLDLLAPAVRLEPTLLRALRQALPSAIFDVGAEAAAWVHPDLEPTAFALTWADQDAVERRRAAYRVQPASERHLAGALIRRHHAHLTGSVRAEEEGNLTQLGGGAPEDTELADYYARTLRTFDDADPDQRAALTAWAARLGTRQHADAWGADPRRAALWLLAHREQLRNESCTLPPGLALSMADWVLATGGEPRRYTLVQQGQSLVAISQPSHSGRDASIQARNGDAADTPAPGSPLADLWLTDAPVQYASLDDPDRLCTVPLTRGEPMRLAGSGVILSGHAEALRIESMTRPDWASGIGRDRTGLYVEVSEGQGMRRLRWVSPAEGLSCDEVGDLGVLRVPICAFWDEREFLDWPGQAFTRPAWAQRVGIDDFGKWAEFDFKSVTQRMRWVWPGEFTMGSPPDEPERFGHERQHQVLLTRGLWLADTACTQALWQAVMGENPSEFKSAERPVGQVSWDQVQQFIGRVNAALPELELCLPTEAQWEYACRAGTQTPFSFGNQVNQEQVNYDGNYPYASGAKGLDRQETIEVKSLPFNDWGMYQMHGNVWEWCQDWFGDYPEGTAIDPAGAATGLVRVVRGGCWILGARSCRSGQRNHGAPASRNDRLGFRLARGL
uniref:SUMF1/EgtB/PvdO family nonheme iron enzyme n=1 Tax=uncultured Thiodictyon sp. TaxID=1846217 RepID=UPI0025CBE35F